jgi:hypothetical protein
MQRIGYSRLSVLAKHGPRLSFLHLPRRRLEIETSSDSLSKTINAAKSKHRAIESSLSLSVLFMLNLSSR